MAKTLLTVCALVAAGMSAPGHASWLAHGPRPTDILAAAGGDSRAASVLVQREIVRLLHQRLPEISRVPDVEIHRATSAFAHAATEIWLLTDRPFSHAEIENLIRAIQHTDSDLTTRSPFAERGRETAAQSTCAPLLWLSSPKSNPPREQLRESMGLLRAALQRRHGR